jgi:hypothetical protein
MRKKVLLWMSAILFAGLMIANVGVILAESGGGQTDPSCDAGGPGSTSCSLTIGAGVGGIGGEVSCSVTCGPGYYACCSISEMGCRCKPYTTSSGGGSSQ